VVTVTYFDSLVKNEVYVLLLENIQNPPAVLLNAEIKLGLYVNNELVKESEAFKVNFKSQAINNAFL
jgi:hypothetical protein